MPDPRVALPRLAVRDTGIVLRDTRYVNRDTSDGIAGTIYSTVRSSNKGIGGLARVLMKLKDDVPAARSNQSEMKNGQVKTETTRNNGERQDPDESQY